MSSLTKRKCNSSKSIGIYIDNTETESSHETNEEKIETTDKSIVEPYLVSILRPLNIIQNVFFCAKYRIKGHVIKPISRLYSVVSVIFYLLLTACLFCILFVMPDTNVEPFEHFVGNIFHIGLFSVGGFVNFFVNIKQKYNNVLYVLKIQNVHRILKLDERCYNRTIISNWLCVLAINCFHVYDTSMNYFAYTNVNILKVLPSYASVRFDVNVIYATRCLRLMTQSLKVWTSDLEKLSAYCINDSLDNNYRNAMFECYVDIIGNFQIVENTFYPMVFFYLIHTCSNALLEIWVRVERRPTTVHYEIQYTLLSFSSLLWVIKNVLIITFLCVECEKYYSAIKQVESTCSQMITSERSSEKQKIFSKNIVRVQGATFNKLRVCGLFAVDASLPLRVCAFITTYTIVLLQFVFL